MTSSLGKSFRCTSPIIKGGLSCLNDDSYCSHLCLFRICGPNLRVARRMACLDFEFGSFQKR